MYRKINILEFRTFFCYVIKNINLDKWIYLGIFNEVFVFLCLSFLFYRNWDYEIIILLILFVVFYKLFLFFLELLVIFLDYIFILLKIFDSGENNFVYNCFEFKKEYYFIK